MTACVGSNSSVNKQNGPSTCVSKHRRPSNAISARCRPAHYFLLPGQRDTTYGGASNNSSSHFFSHAVNSGIGAQSTQILFLTKIAPPCRSSGTSSYRMKLPTVGIVYSMSPAVDHTPITNG